MEELIEYIQKQKKLFAKLEATLKLLNQPQSDEAKRVTILRKELSTIDKIRPDLRADPVFLSNIDTSLNTAKDELKKKEEELKARFGLQLSQLLPQQMPLEGQYPSLRTSFYTLNIDIPSNRVTIYFGPEMEKLTVVKAIPEDVINELKKLNGQIIDRPYNELEFLRTIFSAYQMYLSNARKQMGDEAPLPDIHALMMFLLQKDKFRKNPSKDTLSEYNRAMFSYDLARLKNRTIENVTLRLITATRIDTRTSGEFLWVPAPEGGTRGETFARLKFSGGL